jgi:lipopolysaccharide export system permease protein
MPGTTPASLRAELHKRLINILTPIMLPFLAVPFALGRRRSRRAYQFGLALVILIALHELIEQGAIASVASAASPWLSMWLPFAAVTVFALWRFWRVSFHLPSGRIDEKIDDIADGVTQAAGDLLRRLGVRAAS